MDHQNSRECSHLPFSDTINRSTSYRRFESFALLRQLSEHASEAAIRAYQGIVMQH